MNRYLNIPTTRINKKPVYRTVRYPEIPLDENDTYVTTVQGDRFDVLALQYYQDESLWWIISTANDALPQNSLIIPEGIQLRIPANVVGTIQSYNKLNS
jgi:phage tail protein X